MATVHQPAECILRRGARSALLCVLLTALGLGLVGGITRLRESATPLADLSQRAPAATATLRPADNGNRLRFAVATMVSAEATFSTYCELVRRISRAVGMEESFLLHANYAEVRRALERGRVDVAFVCTGTYVHSLPGKKVKLLAQPEFLEGLQYRSVLLVPADSAATGFEDLRGARMAFTDPESNTGCIVPRAELAARGLWPETFFRKVLFTGSHDHSIKAVVLGVVDAAAVDSLVWESALRQDPSLAEGARVIWASEAFGPPPIVVPAGLDETLEAKLREAFLSLHEDEEGRQMLSKIGIKRFVAPRPEDYESAIRTFESLQAAGGGE